MHRVLCARSAHTPISGYAISIFLKFIGRMVERMIVMQIDSTRLDLVMFNYILNNCTGSWIYLTFLLFELLNLFLWGEKVSRELFWNIRVFNRIIKFNKDFTLILQNHWFYGLASIKIRNEKKMNYSIEKFEKNSVFRNFRLCYSTNFWINK